MWEVHGNGLVMTEGDYGVDLPVTISGFELESGDALKFTFKAATDGEVLLEKTYSSPENNAVFLRFSESESELFSANRTYVYSLDLYHTGEFLCNVIRKGAFKVVEKI